MDIEAGSEERKKRNRIWILKQVVRKVRKKTDTEGKAEYRSANSPQTQHTVHISAVEKIMTYRHLVFATAPTTCLCSYPKVPGKKNIQKYLNNMRNTRQ
jgi:hypothetical protein